MRALFFVFAAPWPVVAFLAFLAFGAGYLSIQDHHRTEELKVQALKLGPPTLTRLTEIGVGATLPYKNEINVEAYADLSLNATLTLTKKRIFSSSEDERMLYFLFDATESRENGQLRAVVLLPKAQAEEFASYVAGHQKGYVGANPEFTLSGSADRNGVEGFDRLIYQAAKASDLELAPGFMVIAPWLDGREAALASAPITQSLDVQFFGGLGGALTFLSGLKFLRRKRQATRPVQSEAPVMRHSATAALPHSVVPPSPVIRTTEPRVTRKMMAIVAIYFLGLALLLSFGGQSAAIFILAAGVFWLLERKRITRQLAHLGFGKRQQANFMRSSSSDGLPPKNPFDRVR